MNIPLGVARAQGRHGTKGAVHGIKGVGLGLLSRMTGGRNEAEFKRHEKRQAATTATASYAQITVLRLTQRTVKFIRWVKNHLEMPRDWDEAIARLAKIYSRL